MNEKKGGHSFLFEHVRDRKWAPIPPRDPTFWVWPNITVFPCVCVPPFFGWANISLFILITFVSVLPYSSILDEIQSTSIFILLIMIVSHLFWREKLWLFFVISTLVCVPPFWLRQNSAFFVIMTSLCLHLIRSIWVRQNIVATVL